jgi:hypothetical protein
MNPANDPNYIFALIDKMESCETTREAAWRLMARGNFNFLLHDTQREIAKIIGASGNECLIFCSRQLGKSFFIIVYAISHILTYGRKTIVRVFSATENQVRDIVADNLDLITRLTPPGMITRKKSDNRWVVGRHGGEIRLGPLAAAHVDGKRGGNASLIILEEPGFVKSDELRTAVGSVINPQLLRSSGKLVHVTTPSADPAHYIHQIVLPRCEATGSIARYTIYDNPQLSEAQIQTAKERCTTDEEWRREYLCEIVRSEHSTVIPEFDNAAHTRELPIPAYAYWQTVLDMGGTRDKHAGLMTYNDFDNDRLVIEDEIFLSPNTPTAEIVAKTTEMEQQARWLDGKPRRVSDSPGQVLVDLRASGFMVRAPEKESGSWEAGINAVRGAFARGQIVINPRCHWLRRTLEYGQYNKTRTDFERTEELGHLDLIAALMYAWRHRVKANPYPDIPAYARRESHYIAKDTRDRGSALKRMIGG